MSAIAGAVEFGRDADSREVDLLLATMATRAPEGSTTWTQGRVALGQGLLRLTSHCSTVARVLTSADGNWALCFDGRIDNRDALGTSLGGRTEPGDAALVLAALERWAEGAFPRLVGDFAFAAWSRAEQALWLVRDPVGARSVHWWRDEDSLLFASDDEALASLPRIPCEPNLDRVAAALLPGFADFDPEEGWLRDIRLVPPGHVLRVDGDGGTRLTTYRQLKAPPPLRLRSDRDYEDELRAVFLEAVRCRAETLQPGALMLSGGLDSLAVLGAARALEREDRCPPMHVYSIVRDDPGCVESRHVRTAVAGMGERAHLYRVDDAGMAQLRNELGAAIWSHPHPIENSIPSVQFLASMAARAGHRALFSGLSGDLALHSSTYYMAPLLRQGRWLAAWREIRQARRVNTYLQGASLPEVLARSLWHAFAPGPLRRWRSQRQMAEPSLAALEAAFDPEVLARLGKHRGGARKASLEASLRGPIAAHLHALAIGSLHSGLEGYGRTAARYGMVNLDPWSDERLLAFCLSLPPEQISGQGWSKWIARRAFSFWFETPILWHSGKAHLGSALLDPHLDPSPLADPREAGVKGDHTVRRLLHLLAASHPASYDANDSDSHAAYSRRVIARWLFCLAKS